MEPGEAMGDGEDRRDLLRRLKESATTTSLTLMSIVQGVALADLAGVVASGYTHFSATQWLLVFPTFLLLIAAWNQVTMDTLAWVQVPDMFYAIIPFIVGAFELFINHAIQRNEQAWLIGVAIMVTLSTLAIGLTNRSAAFHAENTSLFAYLAPLRKSGKRYNLVGTVVLLLLALMSALGGFAEVDRRITMPGAANFVSGVVVALFLLEFIRRHLLYWHVVVAYAEAKPSFLAKARKHHL
ncbi:MAG: hypothetical protein ABI068_11880 [Ktedonobacterales bacterium]